MNKSDSAPLIVHVGKSDSLLATMQFQLQLLKSAGCDIRVLTSSDKWGKQLEANSITVEDVPFSTKVSPRDMVASYFKLRSSLSELKPALIHTHNPIPSTITRLVVNRFMPEIPVVNTVHGWVFYDNQPRWQKLFFTRLERYLARITALTLFQSADDLEFAVAHDIVSRNQAHYIGNGIDIESFRRRYDSANSSALRRALSIPDDKTVISMVSRLVPIKGPDLFIRSLARLRDMGIDFVALLVGDGKNRRQYARLAQKLGLQNQLKFLGHRADIPELLTITDILALTSKKEGIPRTIMEAMTVGVPVVATDVRGTREVVRDGVTGRLSIASPDAFAQALADLITCPRLARSLAVEAMHYAEANFSQRQVTSRVLSAYDSLLC